jgi:hypothetical protein
MNLNLDHTQRLNLVAILDGLECQGRREAFAVCRLQEKLELNDEERTHIGWRKQKDERGREFVLWNAQAQLPSIDYEFPDDDVQRICRALDKYPVVLARDKNWYLPLTMQLPEKEEQKAEPVAAGAYDGSRNGPPERR